VPLRVEGPTRTMRGVPGSVTFSRRLARSASDDRPVVRADAVIGGALEPVPHACGGGAVGRRQRRARWAFARRARHAAAPE
jgi:hypothetical protein